MTMSADDAQDIGVGMDGGLVAIAICNVLRSKLTSQLASNMIQLTTC